jgi:hypothetical protein
MSFAPTEINRLTIASGARVDGPFGRNVRSGRNTSVQTTYASVRTVRRIASKDHFQSDG